MNKYFIILFFLAVTIVMAGNVKGATITISTLNNGLVTRYDGGSLIDNGLGLYNLTGNAVNNSDGAYNFTPNMSLSSANNQYIKNSTNWSMSFWINLHSNKTQDIFTNSYGTNDRFEMNMNGLSVVKIGFGNSTTWWYKKSADSGLSLNTWYFISVDYDTTNQFKLYINNVLQTGTDNPTGSFTTGFRIGNLSTSSYADYSIDEIRIYNRTLSTDEMWDIRGLSRAYNSCITPFEILQIHNFNGSICTGNYVLTNPNLYGVLKIYDSELDFANTQMIGNNSGSSWGLSIINNSVIRNANISKYALGINLGGSNNLVINSLIDNCSTYGIQARINKTNNIIDNVTVSNAYDNIVVQSNYSIVRNCIVKSFAHSGIDFHNPNDEQNLTYVENISIYNNMVYDGETGIYGTEAKNVLIYNNQIHDNIDVAFNSVDGSLGISVGGGSYATGLKIYNNVISSVSGYCSKIATQGFWYYNNSVSNCGRHGLLIYENDYNISQDGNGFIQNMTFGTGDNIITTQDVDWLNISTMPPYTINQTSNHDSLVNLFNLLMGFPFNDVYNVSSASVLSSNVDNYSITLSAGQQIIIDDYYCNKHYIDSGISYTCNATTCKFTTSNCTFISGRTS